MHAMSSQPLRGRSPVINPALLHDSKLIIDVHLCSHSSGDLTPIVGRTLANTNLVPSSITIDPSYPVVGVKFFTPNRFAYSSSRVSVAPLTQPQLAACALRPGRFRCMHDPP